MAGTSLIPQRQDISKSPAIVDKRSRIGDWEGDTVHGKKGYLVTLVDRMSRFTLVRRVSKRTNEFADHLAVSEATVAEICFAKPHASWQRGTNENTNGRLRCLWSKKFDLATLADEDIQDGVFILNLTPRKVLGGLTPLEVVLGKSVALIVLLQHCTVASLSSFNGFPIPSIIFSFT